MVLPSDDCGECGPAGLQHRSQASTAIIFSSVPFFVTFLFVATVVSQRLLLLLSGEAAGKVASAGSLLFPPSSTSKSNQGRAFQIKRFSAFIFSTTIASAVVLAELILCELSDKFNPVVRAFALQLTIFLLLGLLIVVIPSLEIHSIISSAGWKYTGSGSGKLKVAWLLQILVFGAWLFGFWWSGQVILPHQPKEKGSREGWVNATTEHVGVIGISLMALLSGFASVSAPWQSFGAQARPVSETTIARKQAGLASTNEMLHAKRSRLRAIEQKLSNAAPESFLQKAVGSLRGNADVTEKQALEMEISGLEDMAASLSADQSMLSTRYTQQQRSHTAQGRLIRTASHVFSLYCLYRVAAVSLTFMRRRWASPDQHFVGSDPINNILALLVNHWDSNLDRQVWTRQISFLLSGVMLFASFSSVLQTYHIFAKYTPGLLKAAQANLALLVAQICATYVISVALLLRSLMPGEAVSDRLKALGGDDMQWVDGWFEAWFLGGVVVTIVGIWIGKKISGIDAWDDDVDVEMGKLR